RVVHVGRLPRPGAGPADPPRGGGRSVPAVLPGLARAAAGRQPGRTRSGPSSRRGVCPEVAIVDPGFVAIVSAATELDGLCRGLPSDGVGDDVVELEKPGGLA